MKRIIFSLLILLLHSSIWAQLPTSGLVAWYPFCGDTKDYSGNGYNMRDSGATLTTDRFGSPAAAYEFNGVNNMIYYKTFFPATGNLTYSCWIDPYVIQAPEIMHNGNTNTDGLGFVMTNGIGGVPGKDIDILFGGISLYLVAPISINQWHHLVVRRKGSVFDLIIDTVLVGSFTGIFNPPTGKFAIGMDYTNGTNPFNGKMDDVAIYNRDLADSEIRQLYHYNPNCSYTTASCDSISLPETIKICKNSTVTLPATLLGSNPVLDIRWSPPTGLSDTSILNPVLTSGSSSGWYYVTVSSLSSANLIVNGDFSAGNTGFTSGYAYVPPSPSALWPAGVYVVDTDPHKDHPLAPSFGDHTTGTGNMMAMNGASTPIDVWCETVPVTPNTDYAFSAWFSNWSGDTLTNLPLIQFRVNGTLLGTGTFKFIPTQGLWTKFYSTWNSGTSSSASICIYDIQTAAYGNDFAIDDISFQQMCTTKDSVFINVSAADSSHNHYDTSVCSISGNLTLNGPAGYSTYLWNTGATTSSVTVGSSGSYWLYGTGNCGTLKDTFNVYFISPDTVKKYKDTMLCASVGAITLNAPSGYHSWLWNNGASTPSISVSGTGTYWVSASSNSGCSIISDTMHVVLSPLPIAFIGNDTSICAGDKIKLICSTDQTTTYLWSTGSTAPFITVTEAGTYSVAVSSYGCNAETSIKIREIARPQINLGNDTTLCSGELLKLPVSASNATFLWSDGSKAPDFTATETGVYWATASNICGSVTDTISITYDFCDIWFPSAFTPNGDGRNDIIRVVGSLSAYKDFSYSIFNRWGQRVFYTENIYDGWDGTFNGSKQDLGTYFYMIYYSLNGKKSMMKGDFQLIR